MRYDKVRFDVQYHQKDSDFGVSLEVRVSVNAKLLPDILDVNEFYQSLLKSGQYPLFTCVCGDFGCSGYYVDIECTDLAWTVKNRYDPLDSAKLVEGIWYDIAWSQLEELVLHLSETIKAFRQQHPGTVVGVGEMGRVLPDQEEMDLALQTIREHIQKHQ
jgi:hypothetical protein